MAELMLAGTVVLLPVLLVPLLQDKVDPEATTRAVLRCAAAATAVWLAIAVAAPMAAQMPGRLGMGGIVVGTLVVLAFIPALLSIGMWSALLFIAARWALGAALSSGLRLEAMATAGATGCAAVATALGLIFLGVERLVSITSNQSEPIPVLLACAAAGAVTGVLAATEVSRRDVAPSRGESVAGDRPAARPTALRKLSAVAGVFWLLLFGGGALLPDYFAEDRAQLAQAEVGMTEQEVRAILGAPHRVLEATSAPEDYYVDGWGYDERPISNKVHIYFGGEPIAYVYYDHNNHVEHVFVGGS